MSGEKDDDPARKDRETLKAMLLEGVKSAPTGPVGIEYFDLLRDRIQREMVT